MKNKTIILLFVCSAFAASQKTSNVTTVNTHENIFDFEFTKISNSVILRDLCENEYLSKADDNACYLKYQPMISAFKWDMLKNTIDRNNMMKQTKVYREVFSEFLQELNGDEFRKMFTFFNNKKKENDYESFKKSFKTYFKDSFEKEIKKNFKTFDGQTLREEKYHEFVYTNLEKVSSLIDKFNFKKNDINGKEFKDDINGKEFKDDILTN